MLLLAYPPDLVKGMDRDSSSGEYHFSSAGAYRGRRWRRQQGDSSAHLLHFPGGPDVQPIAAPLPSMELGAAMPFQGPGLHFGDPTDGVAPPPAYVTRSIPTFTGVQPPEYQYSVFYGQGESYAPSLPNQFPATGFPETACFLGAFHASGSSCPVASPVGLSRYEHGGPNAVSVEDPAKAYLPEDVSEKVYMCREMRRVQEEYDRALERAHRAEVGIDQYVTRYQASQDMVGVMTTQLEAAAVRQEVAVTKARWDGFVEAVFALLRVNPGTWVDMTFAHAEHVPQGVRDLLALIMVILPPRATTTVSVNGAVISVGRISSTGSRASVRNFYISRVEWGGGLVEIATVSGRDAGAAGVRDGEVDEFI